MKTLIFFWAILLWMVNSGHAQSRDGHDPSDLLSFNNWLQHSWLRSEFTFQRDKMTEKGLLVELSFNCESGCEMRWRSLQRVFFMKSGDSFEDYLIEKISFLTDQPKQKISLRITNKHDEFDLPCFIRDIHFDNSIQVTEANCKDAGSKIVVSYKDFHPNLAMAKLTLENADQKVSKILEYLYQKSNTYFSGLASAKVSRLDNSSPYEICFEVRNLKNIVIPKSALHAATNETLRFKILCNIHSTAAEFAINLNGKFSGNFGQMEPRDMEVDHTKELGDYVVYFSNNMILPWLRSLK